MKTIAITGATGQIGYALIFQLMRTLHSTPIYLRLIDLPIAQQRLDALKMELEDCAFKNLMGVTVTSDLKEGFKDADWALLVGSMPRKEGMERADLLMKNGAIFKEQGQAINEVAKRSVKVFVVGNPCNTNALIACHHAPDIADEQFFSMTMLDELRAKSMLANKANVHVNDVKKMIIFGNHSKTQFPAYPFATINGQKVTSVINDEEWLENEFIPAVQTRGATVIKVRGGSSAASAANAVCESVLRIDYPDDQPFSLGVVSKGEYGAKPGLVISYPCVMQDGQVNVIEDWEMDERSKDYFSKTCEELASEYDQIRSLGLVD